jgi:hypothetical protein
VDYEAFLASVLAADSFAAVASLIFDNADLIDDAFFAATGSLDRQRKEIVYESVLRAYGLLEDPEITGPREWRAIELTVRDLVPEPDRSDYRRLLALAAPDEIGESYTAAIRLAMVRYAVGQAADGAPSFLLARADSARAGILSDLPGRAFDALQYARRALGTFQTLVNEQPGDDRAAIESAYIRLTNASFGMYESLRREARSAGFDW